MAAVDKSLSNFFISEATKLTVLGAKGPECFEQLGGIEWGA